MKFRIFLWITVLGMVSVACSGGSDEENKFEISFESNEYTAKFHTPGQTEQIHISSNIGEGGDTDINLGPGTDPSIFYNGATGTVEWTRELPLGLSNVTITAISESREATTQITIRNDFQGAFDGGYNFNSSSESLTSPGFSVQFNTDGTLGINDNGNSGTGTWQRFEEIVEFTYTYDGYASTSYIFQGTLHYSETEAYIDGFFYRNELIYGNERGYFRVDINN